MSVVIIRCVLLYIQSRKLMLELINKMSLAICNWCCTYLNSEYSKTVLTQKVNLILFEYKVVDSGHDLLYVTV